VEALVKRFLPFGLVLVVAVAALGVDAGLVAGDRARPELPPEDQKAAADAVYLFLSLGSHLRGTAGDPRYSERLPAAPEVVDEMLGEIQWVRQTGRVEEPKLVRGEVRAVETLGPDEARVRTKEFWVTRDLSAPDEKPRSDVVLAKYVLRREASGWRIVDWDLDLAADRRGGT
jgi:hypothetical protein